MTKQTYASTASVERNGLMNFVASYSFESWISRSPRSLWGW